MSKNAYDPKYDTLPIPTYEEATSSRPSSSQSYQRPQETADDAERRGLLGRNDSSAASRHTPRPRRNGNYQAPTVESDRESVDSDFTLPDVSDDGEEDDEAEDAALRRDMEEMEVDDSEAERRAQQRAWMRLRFSKSLATITDTISSWRLPSFRSFSLPFPNLRAFSPTLPRVSESEGFRLTWPIVARLVAIALIVALVYGLIILRVFGPRHMGLAAGYGPEAWKQIIQTSVSPGKIETYLREITAGDHVAGTKGDYFLAEYIENHMKAASFDSVWFDDFEVYLNYPKQGGRKVAIIDPPSAAFEAEIEEPAVPEPVRDGLAVQKQQTQVFHGYSKSGNITGPLIYANYGSRADFEWLESQNIHLKGSIVLMRQFGTQPDPSQKVKTAQDYGAAGCILYSDPAEDGFTRGDVYPDGPWRNGASVQRGSVAQPNIIVGDPLTPGKPSQKDTDRIPLENNPALPQIPSIPLPWNDANVFLRSLVDSNAGVRIPDNWKSTVGSDQLWTGDAQSSPVIHLMNEQDEPQRQPIRNVIGKIEGLENPDLEVYVGNHRDAWCFGSVDPGSGTAVFLELIRLFGELVEVGWRPRRTIVFASWDAGEYNSVGSTEHVEERGDSLHFKGLAYLNVDAGVAGDEFFARGPDLFRQPLLRALDRVTDPTGNFTLAEVWEHRKRRIDVLGGNGDYVPFQDLAGVSSLDFGFATDKTHGDDLWSPKQAYPYGSCYENAAWSAQFNDPDLRKHSMLAEIWGLLIIDLSMEPILSMNLGHYSMSISAAAQRLEQDLGKFSNDNNGPPIDMKPMRRACAYLAESASRFQHFEEEWKEAVVANSMETRELAIQRVGHNKRLADFEKNLLDLPQLRPALYGADTDSFGQASSRQNAERNADEPAHHQPGGEGSANNSKESNRTGGLPGREQFKHVIFAPPLDNKAYVDTAGVEFPGIRDALGKEDYALAQEWVDITAKRIEYAAWRLAH